MTEPLLLAGITLSTALVFRWVLDDGVGPPAAAGWAIVGACLTRYEAWPVTAALLGLAGIALLARGVRVRDVVLRVVGLAVYPAGAVLAFLVLSRATVGEWFVTGGFYVPDNEAHGKPLVGLAVVGWGLWKLVGAGTLAAGAVGVLLASWAVWRDRRRAAVITTFALAGCAALPWYAFVSGHPFRIRYMVVLVAALAACAGLGVGLLPRRTLRGVAAGLVLLVALVERPPFASTAPMVAEAQWDRPFAIGRRKVTACLAAGFVRPRHKVLVSMGSLAHYMQELSHAGFALDDFVHEGIGQLWPEALAAPSRHVAWILVEERAEGGDMLAALRRRDPHFTLGFARVCEGGGVALYRRESAERREAGHATARVISERPAVRIDDIR